MIGKVGCDPKQQKNDDHEDGNEEEQEENDYPENQYKPEPLTEDTPF